MKKWFIMIIGGIASGKSYIYNKYFNIIPCINIDDYTKQLSNNDFELARKKVSEAIKLAENDLKKYFKTGKSVVSQGTGAKIQGVLNKLKLAKEYGYKSCIVLVQTPIEIAQERNEKRAHKNERNLIPDYKIQRTNIYAKNNFHNYFKQKFDNFIIINN